MKYKTTLCFVLFLSFIAPGMNLFAEENAANSRDFQQEMRNMIKNILVDNKKFQEDPRHDDAFFQRQSAGQHPRTTIVGCADSRVHTSNFDFHPLGDIFFIRNIGNQIETCLGSVDYGVLHLETSLLLFLGHSKCGAITAATQGLEEYEESIQHDLEPIQVTHRTPTPTDKQIAENVAENVHHQVNKALERYPNRIAEGKLWVVGAVYDFTLEGRGKLKVIQVNDHTDQEFIVAFLEEARTWGKYCDDPGRELSKQGSCPESPSWVRASAASL